MQKNETPKLNATIANIKKLNATIAKILQANIDMTNRKLEALVYYCYVWNLVINSERLFTTEFIAGVHGPFIEQLHSHLRQTTISDLKNKRLSTSALTDIEIDIIEQVVHQYGKFSKIEIVELVQSEEPWLVARGECKMLDYCPNALDDNLIKEYYSKLL
jgi:hypothetical protein